MPCIFCLAVFAVVAGAVSAGLLDGIEERLRTATGKPVERVTDTESTAQLRATFEVGGKQAPVAITVYKRFGRVRIQVLTHALTAVEVEQLEHRIAELLELRIVAHAPAESVAKVHEAFHHQADAFARGGEVGREGPGTAPPGPAPPAR